MFSDIKASEKWESVEPINKGWSSDEKYFVRTFSDEHFAENPQCSAGQGGYSEHYEEREKTLAAGKI